jgi:integrase
MGTIYSVTSANGKRRFRARVRKQGGRQDSHYFDKKSDAQRWIQYTEKAIRERRYFEQAEARQHTLSQAIDRYLAEVPCAPGKAQQLERWRSELGHLFLSDITRVDLSETLFKWKAKGLSGKKQGASSINNHLSSISCVLTKLVRWGWLNTNLARDVERESLPPTRGRYLEKEELSALLVACKQSTWEPLYLVVLLAITTGMRKNEIRFLKWADIKLGENVLYITCISRTKNKAPRKVSLCSAVVELLRTHAKVRRLDSEYVFPSEIKPSVPFDFKKHWEAARDVSAVTGTRLQYGKAGIPQNEKFRFHDLRHSHASFLAMLGYTTAQIAASTGHSGPTVNRYIHLSPSQTAPMAERLGEELLVSQNK